MSFWPLTLIDFLKQIGITKMKMPGLIYFKDSLQLITA